MQKLTELGVDEIRPFVAERSVVRWTEEKRTHAAERWRTVAREASMQSRRCWLPVVYPPCRFADVAALDGAALADRDGGPVDLAHPVLLIGPEGGWSDTERDLGLATVRLGPQVLRAETAAIAAATLLASAREQRVLTHAVAGSAEKGRSPFVARTLCAVADAYRGDVL